MSENPQKVIQFGADLSERFEINDVGRLRRCLGIDFTQNDEGIKIN